MVPASVHRSCITLCKSAFHVHPQYTGELVCADVPSAVWHAGVPPRTQVLLGLGRGHPDVHLRVPCNHKTRVGGQPQAMNQLTWTRESRGRVVLVPRGFGEKATL